MTQNPPANGEPFGQPAPSDPANPFGAPPAPPATEERFGAPLNSSGITAEFGAPPAPPAGDAAPANEPAAPAASAPDAPAAPGAPEGQPNIAAAFGGPAAYGAPQGQQPHQPVQPNQANQQAQPNQPFGQQPGQGQPQQPFGQQPGQGQAQQPGQQPQQPFGQPAQGQPQQPGQQPAPFGGQNAPGAPGAGAPGGPGYPGQGTPNNYAPSYGAGYPGGPGQGGPTPPGDKKSFPTWGWFAIGGAVLLLLIGGIIWLFMAIGGAESSNDSKPKPSATSSYEDDTKDDTKKDDTSDDEDDEDFELADTSSLTSTMTKPGTNLKMGEKATLPFAGGLENVAAAIEVSMTKIDKAPDDQVKLLTADNPQLLGMDVYYMSVDVTNVEGGDIAYGSGSFRPIDSQGNDVTKIYSYGSGVACGNSSFPRSFKKGDSTTLCYIAAAAPGGNAPSGLLFYDYDAYSSWEGKGVTWQK